MTGDSELGEGPGERMQTESAPRCVSNNVLGQPQGIGQGETRERAAPNGYKRRPEKFVTKKVGAHVNPADLMTKPVPRPMLEQLMHIMSYRFEEQYKGQSGLHRAKSACHQQTAERSLTLNSVAVVYSNVDGADYWMV